MRSKTYSPHVSEQVSMGGGHTQKVSVKGPFYTLVQVKMQSMMKKMKMQRRKMIRRQPVSEK